jgi:hypothetical protein
MEKIMDEKKNVALKMVINGEERDVTWEELALSNNLAQEALVRVLIEKKVLQARELMDMMEKVKKERYRTVDQQK